MFVAHRDGSLSRGGFFQTPTRRSAGSPSPSAPPRCPRLRADPTARTRTTATHTAPSRSATGRARLIRLPGAGNRQPRRRRRRASTRSFRRARAGPDAAPTISFPTREGRPTTAAATSARPRRPSSPACCARTDTSTRRRARSSRGRARRTTDKTQPPGANAGVCRGAAERRR